VLIFAASLRLSLLCFTSGLTTVLYKVCARRNYFIKIYVNYLIYVIHLFLTYACGHIRCVEKIFGVIFILLVRFASTCQSHVFRLRRIRDL
jgi:hypothetical protein